MVNFCDGKNLRIFMLTTSDKLTYVQVFEFDWFSHFDFLKRPREIQGMGVLYHICEACQVFLQ